MTANLDAQFGHCVTPVRINIAEGNHYPSTLFSLNGQTAPRLRRFIDMSSERDRFANFAFQDFAILWVGARQRCFAQSMDVVVTRLKPVCYAFETNEIEVEKGSKKIVQAHVGRGERLFGPLVWSIPGSMVRRKFQSNRRR
jgi:hypothetical protein